MTDPFDKVIGTRRGGGKRAQTDDTPLAAAREVVRLLNSDELEFEMPWTEVVRRVIFQHGLFIREHLSLEREHPRDVWEFNGFLIVVSAKPRGKAVATIRLRHKRSGREPYAELWQPDSG
jgi:hypothetical protein